MLYRFEFPERPGALLRFLQAVGTRWNISLFHYRNHGSDYGRVLAGIQVPPPERADFVDHLNELHYAYTEETAQPGVPDLPGRLIRQAWRSSSACHRVRRARRTLFAHDPHVERMMEQRTVVHERVELAVLTAGIHAGRQIRDEACIELPPAELIAQIARVGAYHERAETAMRWTLPPARAGRAATAAGKASDPPSRTRVLPSPGELADRCRRRLPTPMIGLAQLPQRPHEHLFVLGPACRRRHQLETERSRLKLHEPPRDAMRAAAQPRLVEHREHGGRPQSQCAWHATARAANPSRRSRTRRPARSLLGSSGRAASSLPIAPRRSDIAASRCNCARPADRTLRSDSRDRAGSRLAPASRTPGRSTACAMRSTVT